MPYKQNMENRELELMTMGRPVVCPACRETSYLYPKAVGHQPYIWEMNCNLCHKFNLGVNAYNKEHEELHYKLNQLRERYLKGETSTDIESEINDFAEEYDNKLNNQICECGGHLSICAKPKCIYCDVVIFDSFFHYSDESPK